ncbi:MAG: Membrane lipoprotein TmpC precursor [bacterium ADurb.Bin157]|nr:MAG: Membrane lipoprotein TmpC precursor [bacterium ADurb.Bin157]
MPIKSTVFKKSVFCIGVLTLLICSFCLSGCCDKIEKAPKSEAKSIGLMISPQGLNDKSFNDSAYRGLKEAEKLHNIETTIIEPSTWQDPEQSLRFFAGQKFDAIIVLGVGFNDAVKQIASENLNTAFYVIDSDYTENNIKGITFREEEGAFLCGYLAAKKSQTNKAAFIGGLPIPVIKRFESGFFKGARHANPDIDLVSKYIADDFSGFNNTQKAQQIADELYKSGFEVIFPAAGASAQGVIAAAVTNRKYVIGIDNNQDSLAPGLVLTSLLKRVDRIVVKIIEKVCSDNTGEMKSSYGLAEDALSLTDFQLSHNVIGEALISELAQLKKDIVEGKIKLTE